MCVAAHLETHFTASSTDVQNIVAYLYSVRVSLLKCAPAMLFVSYKYTCHVDFWFYIHRCTQISLTANRGHSGET